MVLLRMMILLVRDVLLASNAAVQAGIDMFMFCCANSCLFCNSSVFLLSSALLPSDPCFSARQSCKNYSYKLALRRRAGLQEFRALRRAVLCGKVIGMDWIDY